jgi:hypothetical protein
LEPKPERKAAKTLSQLLSKPGLFADVLSRSVLEESSMRSRRSIERSRESSST